MNFDSILVAWCALLFVLEFRIQNCATYFFCAWHCLYCCTYVQKWMHSGYWCSYWPYSKLSLNNRLSTFLGRLGSDVCTKISYRQYLFGLIFLTFQTDNQNLKMTLLRFHVHNHLFRTMFFCYRHFLISTIFENLFLKRHPFYLKINDSQIENILVFVFLCLFVYSYCYSFFLQVRHQHFYKNPTYNEKVFSRNLFS